MRALINTYSTPMDALGPVLLRNMLRSPIDFLCGPHEATTRQRPNAAIRNQPRVLPPGHLCKCNLAYIHRQVPTLPIYRCCGSCCTCETVGDHVTTCDRPRGSYQWPSPGKVQRECIRMRAIMYVVGYVREAAIGGSCATLLSAAPDTEGTARTKLNATLGEIHTKSQS